MVSSRTRDHVWQGLLDIARYRRYYGALERKYRCRFVVVRVLLAMAGIGAAAPLIEVVPDLVTAIAGIAIVALVIWDLVNDYGERVAFLRVAVERLNELEIRHRSLWEELDGEHLDDEQVRMRVTDLHEAALDAVRGIKISLDDRLNEQSQANAFEAEGNRYAVR